MLFCVCLSVVVLTCVGVAVLVRATFAAPYAVEDERGFHLLDAAEERSVAVVPVAAPDLTFFHH